MKVVSTEKAPKALGPYSQGYVHNGMFYSAGQIAINPETNVSKYEKLGNYIPENEKNKKSHT